MAEEYLNPEKEPSPNEEPPRENKLLSRLKSVLTLLVLIGIVVASFWVSFQLGKKILMPLKKPSEKKIEVAIPEPPPSIKALQKLREAMSVEAKKVEPKKKEAVRAAKPKPKVARKTVLRRGYYKVQAGLFEEKENADEHAAILIKSGFDAYIKKVDGGWRVQAGAYRAKSAAEALRQELKAKNLDSSIIYE
ncbi:MAG: SPOR domain-containing protein [Candidatus Margulisiibacteriota bacterium]